MKRIKTLLVVFLLSIIIFPLSSEAKTKFKDVPDDYWAKEEIQFLAEKEIIFGYKNGNFGVDDPIRRADAATMLVRALGLDTKNRPEPHFKDVAVGSHAYKYIAAAVDEKIFEGNNGEFQPNAPLTRAQMAAVLTRAFQLSDSGPKASFKDVRRSDWHYDFVQALYANEITFGYTDNTFRPYENITRAQFSAFLARVLKQTEKKEEKLEVVTIY